MSLNPLRFVENFKSKQDAIEIVGDVYDIPLEKLDCREDTFNNQ